MTDATRDGERLAALLDGRLDEGKRAELLAELALSEEDLEILADAAAVTRELEEEDRGTRPDGVLPLRPPVDGTRRSWRPPRWLAAAAIVAGLALAPLLWLASREPGLAAPGTLVERLGPVGELRDPKPWSSTRSAGDQAGGPALAVRVGARLVDLRVAARTGEGAAEVAADLQGMLGRLPGAAAAAARFEVLVREGVTEDRVAEAEATALQAVGPEPARVGAWLQAARLAAVHRRREFFQRRQTEAALSAAERMLAANADRSGIARLRVTLERSEPPDWGLLESDLRKLLEALGG